jgi:circadian clock protein KaiC
MEFVYRGAAELDEPGLLVLFDVAPERAARAAVSFGWDLAAVEHARRLKIVFTTRRIFEQEVQQADSLLLEEARAIGARRLFVDGVAATAHGHADSVRDRFHALAGALQREGLTTLLALETPAAGRPAAPAAELVADAIMVLRTETERRGMTRTLEVVKARGQEVDLGRHAMRIVPARGLEVYRRARAGLPGGGVAPQAVRLCGAGRRHRVGADHRRGSRPHVRLRDAATPCTSGHPRGRA